MDGLGLPTYIYHGTDDNVVGVENDRSAAKALLGGVELFAVHAGSVRPPGCCVKYYLT